MRNAGIILAVLALLAVLSMVFPNPGSITGMAFSFADCIEDKTVLKVSSLSPTYTDQHAGAYNNNALGYGKICSDTASNDHACDAGDNVVIRLSAQTDAHVEQAGLITASYSDTCFGTIKCGYALDCVSLGQDYSCAFSFSSFTNAHVGDCGAYERKTCCTDGIKGNAANCNVNCADSDGCICPAGCNVAQGDIANVGQNCGGLSGNDGVKSSLGNCGVGCNDPDGCSCPTGCNIQGDVLQGTTCGGLLGSDGQKTTMSDCLANCNDPDGCSCPSNCNLQGDIGQSISCGGIFGTGNGIKTAMTNCEIYCTDLDGCTCGSDCDKQEVVNGERCNAEAVQQPVEPVVPLLLSDCNAACGQTLCTCPTGCVTYGIIASGQNCQGPKADEFEEALKAIDELEQAATPEQINVVVEIAKNEGLITEEESSRLKSMSETEAKRTLREILSTRYERLLSPQTPLDWVWTITAALVVCGLLTGAVFGTKKIAHSEHIRIHLERHKIMQDAGLDPKKFQMKMQLQAYIRGAFRAGYTRQQVMQSLIQHKWPLDMIDAAFESMERRTNYNINTNVIRRVVQQRPVVKRVVTQQTIVRPKPELKDEWMQKKEDERSKAVSAFGK